jgi:CheY-like chemotaxis protein
MNKRILIVDDNQYVADASARLISICGYETKVAYGGLEAIQQVETFAPQMVLMDVGMPDLDGYQTAAQIRREHPDAGILMVAVTCWAEEADKQRALESGFDLHVAKPVGLSTLYGLLALLHEKHSAVLSEPPQDQCGQDG